MTVQTKPLSAEQSLEHCLVRRREKGVPSDEANIRRAFDFAVDQYGDSMHWTGETILQHCLGVLQTLTRFDPDDDTVIASLLHHVLDSKRLTLDDLERMYGQSVRQMISGEYLLSHVTMQNRRMSLEHMRLMFMKVSGDVRLVLLILSQQHHIISRLEMMSAEDRKRHCRDTLHIFAPVAARLGIYWLKHQLEGRAFPMMYPVDAVRIEEQLAQVHEKYGDFLPRAAAALVDALKQAGIEAEVHAREKQPYSIFHKMKLKSCTHVEDLNDLFALRVIVQSESDCYQALGVLHQLGHPVVGRFKDYIAFPKPNGYKSVHTTLARLPRAPEGLLMEAQIRTRSMQHEAEYGIAAHWSYKEGGVAEQAFRRAQIHLALTNPEQSAQAPRGVDHIFVLTPRGDIIELPEGSTPLDFAFHVHTVLGLSFKGAKVNGAIVSMDYALENGDIVEILKYPDPRPSSKWLSLLRTASARSRLKRFLVNRERPTYLTIGRDMMNEELKKHHLPPLDTDLTALKLFDGKAETPVEREEILIKIGQGAQNAASTLVHLDALKERLHTEQQDTMIVRPKTASGSRAFAKVEGNIPMPVIYAKCCKPNTKDCPAISGVIGRSGEVRTHCDTCKMLKSVNPERRIAVRWAVRNA